MVVMVPFGYGLSWWIGEQRRFLIPISHLWEREVIPMIRVWWCKSEMNGDCKAHKGRGFLSRLSVEGSR